MKKNNLVYLYHIRDSMNKVIEYTINISFDEFVKKTMIHDAVIRQIEIIGEASKNISEKFKNENDNIPWKRMAGMRDKVIHEYFGVRLNLIWKASIEDIPALKNIVLEIIRKIEEQKSLEL